MNLFSRLVDRLTRPDPLQVWIAELTAAERREAQLRRDTDAAWAVLWPFQLRATEITSPAERQQWWAANAGYLALVEAHQAAENEIDRLLAPGSGTTTPTTTGTHTGDPTSSSKENSTTTREEQPMSLFDKVRVALGRDRSKYTYPNPDRRYWAEQRYQQAERDVEVARDRLEDFRSAHAATNPTAFEPPVPSEPGWEPSQATAEDLESWAVRLREFADQHYPVQAAHERAEMQEQSARWRERMDQNEAASEAAQRTARQVWWGETFDRLSQARQSGVPIQELERRAGAEFDRLTANHAGTNQAPVAGRGGDTVSRTQPLPVVPAELRAVDENAREDRAITELAESMSPEQARDYFDRSMRLRMAEVTCDHDWNDDCQAAYHHEFGDVARDEFGGFDHDHAERLEVAARRALLRHDPDAVAVAQPAVRDAGERADAVRAQRHEQRRAVVSSQAAVERTQPLPVEGYWHGESARNDAEARLYNNWDAHDWADADRQHERAVSHAMRSMSVEQAHEVLYEQDRAQRWPGSYDAPDRHRLAAAQQILGSDDQTAESRSVEQLRAEEADADRAVQDILADHADTQGGPGSDLAVWDPDEDLAEKRLATARQAREAAEQQQAARERTTRSQPSQADSADSPDASTDGSADSGNAAHGSDASERTLHPGGDGDRILAKPRVVRDRVVVEYCDPDGFVIGESARPLAEGETAESVQDQFIDSLPPEATRPRFGPSIAPEHKAALDRHHPDDPQVKRERTARLREQARAASPELARLWDRAVDGDQVSMADWADADAGAVAGAETWVTRGVAGEDRDRAQGPQPGAEHDAAHVGELGEVVPGTRGFAAWTDRLLREVSSPGLSHYQRIQHLDRYAERAWDPDAVKAAERLARSMEIARGDVEPLAEPGQPQPELTPAHARTILQRAGADIAREVAADTAEPADRRHARLSREAEAAREVLAEAVERATAYDSPDERDRRHAAQARYEALVQDRDVAAQERDRVQQGSAAEQEGDGDSANEEVAQPSRHERLLDQTATGGFGFVAPPSARNGGDGQVGSAVDSARDAVNDVTAQRVNTARERVDYDRAQQTNLWAIHPHDLGTGRGAGGGGLSAESRTTSW